MTTTGIAASLGTHLRDPMRRSAYALIAGTGLTSLLGILFWVLAARLLPAEAVGTGTALTSAMTFLATLSTLGLRNSLVRFVAPAGASARRLIVTCYLLCVAAAILAAVVFIAGQPWWASRLDFLQRDRLLAFAFVAATTVWVLFVLEDHVLIGLRRATWVPLTNGIYSGIKIAVLPALVSGGSYALLAAYALPAAPIVAVVTVFVLWITSPRRGVRHPVEKLRIAHLVRFAAADHSSTLLWLATTELLTLVVLQKAGAEASAYYFMAFTIAYALYLITSNVSSAYVAEAARDPKRAGVLAGEALRHAGLLVLPLALLGVVFAPVGLALLGPEYATNATVLLRLLLVSAIPQVVIGISLGAARIRRDNRTILAIYAAQAIGVFGGTALTIDRWGLTGVGFAWLITQTAVALALAVTRRTGVDFGGIDLDGPVRSVGRLVSRLRQHRSRREARQLVPAALQVFGLPTQTDYRLLPSESDSLIVSLDGELRASDIARRRAEEERADTFFRLRATTSADSERDARAAPNNRSGILKIATTAAASRGLSRHAQTVSALHSSLPLSGLLTLLPRALQRGTLHGYTVLLESTLPGVADTKRPPAPAELDAAALAISDLHRMTSSTATVDSALLTDWVDSPIRQLRGVPTLDDEGVGLDRLTEALYSALLGQHVTMSYVHGDYWLGNVLQVRASGTVKVSGIVDWENARPVGLPDCDLIHLWLTSRPGELGTAVRRGVLSPDAVRDSVAELPVSWSNPQLSTPHLVLLAWLWHVTAELQRASRNRVGRLWLARSVRPVLKLVSSGGVPQVLDRAL